MCTLFGCKIDLYYHIVLSTNIKFCYRERTLYIIIYGQPVYGILQRLTTMTTATRKNIVTFGLLVSQKVYFQTYMHVRDIYNVFRLLNFKTIRETD